MCFFGTPPKPLKPLALAENLNALARVEEARQYKTTTTTETRDFARDAALEAVKGILAAGMLSDPKAIAKKAFDIAVELDKHFCDFEGLEPK